ncbi:aspartate kinase [Alphaproteobacteria bacterium]|nr:aspartate kinase [Alphaproteobacteria bacterium]
MSRLVLKFGGTSVADIDRIKNVAKIVSDLYSSQNELVIVVSAMSGATNQLVSWCSEISKSSAKEEYDVVVASGEQVTAGLLALAIQELGISSRSFLGWQAAIQTNSDYSRARIENIEVFEIEKCLKKKEVVVFAGFQGISIDGRITTLGRGGSDTSAVAIAAALKADRCDIYTDVKGIYTTDPRIVDKARKLDKITYEEMLEMSSQGAKVLQTRSVELAMNNNVKLQVRSSFEDSPGTLVVDEDQIMEKAIVSGITYSPNEAKVTICDVVDRPGIAADIFGALASAGINVDMIVQNISLNNEKTDLTFTLPRNQLDFALTELKLKSKELNYRDLISNDNLVKISVIGVGMRSHAGVAETMFSTLGKNDINIHVISTSEIKVSVLIDEKYTELAVKSLHSAYNLDE